MNIDYGFDKKDLVKTEIPKQVLIMLEEVAKKHKGQDLLVALLSLSNEHVKLV